MLILDYSSLVFNVMNTQEWASKPHTQHTQTHDAVYRVYVFSFCDLFGHHLELKSTFYWLLQSLGLFTRLGKCLIKRNTDVWYILLLICHGMLLRETSNVKTSTYEWQVYKQS